MAAIVRRAAAGLSGLALALAGSAADAAGIESSMAEASKFDVTSDKDFYVLERCVVMQSYISTPSVYRTPDRPDESLIYFNNNGIGTPAVVKLEKSAGGVRVRMWQGGGKMKSAVEQCL